MKALFVTFQDRTGFHGGIKRSRQIEEELRKLKFDQFDVVTVRPKLSLHIKSIFLSVAFCLNRYLCGFLSLRGCAVYLACMPGLLDFIYRNKPDAIFIEILPGRMMIAVDSAIITKSNYFAFSHNIEFMVPGQRDRYFRSKSSAFSWEMYILGQANGVIAISEFDGYALTCLGLSHVLVYPFFPCLRDYEWLKGVGNARESDKINMSALIIGSASNSPTKIGMESLLKDVAYNLDVFESVKVVGLGTDELFYTSGKIQVLGPVSQEKLANLISECGFVLMSHTPTSGFTTRLVEFNVIGVPVFIYRSNYLQALELNGYGIYFIDSFLDIKHHFTLEAQAKKVTPPDVSILNEFLLKCSLHQTHR